MWNWLAIPHLLLFDLCLMALRNAIRGCLVNRSSPSGWCRPRCRRGAAPSVSEGE